VLQQKISCDRLSPRQRVPILFAACLLFAAMASAAPSVSAVARLLSRQQGLVVSVGVTDTAFLAGLHREHGFLVHGLVMQETHLVRMRQELQSQHLYGPVSLRKLAGPALPYAKDLATAVVVDDLPGLLSSGLTLVELARILSPYGTLVVLNTAGGPAVQPLLAGVGATGLRQGKHKGTGIAAVYTKPFPKTMDEWTHRYHDASATGMSNDRSLRPVSRVQWLAGPDKAMPNRTGFQRGNYGGVTSGGRLYYVSCHDPSNMALMGRQISQRWHLTARDAFNGLQLWSRNLFDYYPDLVKAGVTVPLSEEDIRKANMKKEGLPAAALGGSLVAAPDRLFGNLFGVPVAFSPETGDLLKVYSVAGRVKAKMISAHDVLFVTTATHLIALQPESGDVLWQQEVAVSGLDRPYNYTGLLQADGNVVALGIMAGDKSRCLIGFEPGTGKVVWKTNLDKQRKEVQALLWCYDGVIVMKWRTHRGVYAFSAEDGRLLWEYAPKMTKTLNVTTVSGLLWLSYRLPNDTRELVAALRDRDAWDGITEALDLRTGEVKKRYTGRDAMMIPSICSYANAISTPEYIITTRPLTFFDVKTGTRTFFDGAMHGCGFGIIPANGMVYAPANACRCDRAAVKSYGAWTADDGLGRRGKQRPQLGKGPAYGASPENETVAAGTAWPLFRHDAQRSAATAATIGGGVKRSWAYTAWDGAALADALRPDWQANLCTQADPLTAPVIQGDIAVVAAIHSHTVYAIDLKSGKPRWTHTADARIHSAPSLSRGRCFVGSADGTVTCLRLRDGAVVWTFRAAPEERLVAAFGQLESPWPILGDILPSGDSIFFLAGRGASTDGGTYYYQLNSRTGEVIGRTQHNDTAQLYRFDLLVESGQSVHPANDRKKLISFAAPGKEDARAKAFIRQPGDFLIRDYAWRYPGMSGAINRYGGGQTVLGYTGLLATYNLSNKQVVTYKRYAYFGGKPKWFTRFGANEITAFIGRNPVRASQLDALKKPYQTWGKKTVYATREGAGHERWNHGILIKERQVETIIQTQDVVFAAGTRNRNARSEGGFFLALSAKTGEVLTSMDLDAPPVADGMAAVNGALILADQSGKVICFRP
jgi:outer membrane protein assembly factor BamB